MIEEIEGPTSEPTRRGHVAVLSAVVASISLALLAVLIAVPVSRIGTLPELASLAADTSVGPVMTIVARTTPFSLSDRPDAFGWCANGRRLDPPYHVTVDATSGRASAIVVDPRTGLSVPAALVRNTGDGWFTVMCGTSGNAMPLDAIAR